MTFESALMKAYQRLKETQHLAEDLKQDQAMLSFDRLYVDLCHAEAKQKYFWNRLNPLTHHEKVIGLYLWGPVGRGKTMLMDLFYEALPQSNKLRIHFNLFMTQVHQDLAKLFGYKDRIKPVAKNIAQQYSVICFDEFYVEDIADAMILGPLCQCLFEQGVCLVVTSNICPDQLYEDGLNRQQFLSSIEMINKNMVVYDFDQGLDHRTSRGLFHTRYFLVLDDAKSAINAHFKQLSDPQYRTQSPLKIKQRYLQVVSRARVAIWFDFYEICGDGRGVDDYLYLSSTYAVVLISALPQLSESSDDLAKRFVILIDELYNQKTLLFLSANVDINDLYKGRRLIQQFERTTSRLIEMQTSQYLEECIQHHDLHQFNLTKL